MITRCWKYSVFSETVEVLRDNGAREVFLLVKKCRVEMAGFKLFEIKLAL